MIDLKSCTFIIPVRIESKDRMRNVITVLCYLLENFDTKVILKEVDTESVFEKEVLPQIKDYLGDAVAVSKDYPIVISKFITDAKEIEVHAVAKNGEVVVSAAKAQKIPSKMY